MNDEEKIIREFIRQSLLYDKLINESAFTSGVKSAVSDFAKVTAGSLGNILASVKQLGGLTYQAIKEVGSLGLFKADYNKVKAQYSKDVSEIHKKYGSAMEEAEKTFSIALAPLTTAMKLGLGATAAAFFFANPVAFIALEGISFKTSEKLKGDVATKVKDVKAKAQQVIDKWSGHDLLDQSWVKEGRQAFTQTSNSYLSEMQNKIDKIVSAKDIKSLGISEDLVRKLSADTKNKDVILKASKSLALNEILNVVKADKQKQIDDAKKVGIPEEIISSTKGYLKIYDSLISKINEKLKSV